MSEKNLLFSPIFQPAKNHLLPGKLLVVCSTEIPQPDHFQPVPEQMHFCFSWLSSLLLVSSNPCFSHENPKNKNRMWSLVLFRDLPDNTKDYILFHSLFLLKLFHIKRLTSLNSLAILIWQIETYFRMSTKERILCTCSYHLFSSKLPTLIWYFTFPA